MEAIHLKNLLKCAKAWPEEAQAELVNVANQIEGELRNREYSSTQDELRIMNAAMAASDCGEVATGTGMEGDFGNLHTV